MYDTCMATYVILVLTHILWMHTCVHILCLCRCTCCLHRYCVHLHTHHTQNVRIHEISFPAFICTHPVYIHTLPTRATPTHSSTDTHTHLELRGHTQGHQHRLRQLELKHSNLLPPTPPRPTRVLCRRSLWRRGRRVHSGVPRHYAEQMQQSGVGPDTPPAATRLVELKM